MIAGGAKVEILARQAGMKLGVVDHGVVVACTLQESRHVERDFCEAGLDIQRGVPGAPLRTVESVEFPGLCVSEARIDEGFMRHAVNQLPGRDAPDPMVLRDEPRTRR